MKTMKTVLFAYHELGYIFLKELLLSDFEIEAVITHPDDPNEKIWFPSVEKLAKANNIPVILTDKKNWQQEVKKFKPDIIFSVMFRKIIPMEILNSAARGAFNLHPSLLPKYRGRCPANWVLINGEKETGITIHKMTAKADRGDILAQTKIEISADDTIAALYNKFADFAPKLIGEIFNKIKSGNLNLTPQNESQALEFGRRTPEDGFFDWNMPSVKIHNLVRGVTHPYPGAFCKNKQGKKLFIWRTALSTMEIKDAKPAQIISLNPLTAATADGALEIKRLGWENERELCAKDFIDLYKIKQGDFLV
jgi:UDP-4-amino-4-deoxy-L-arabinose formyltransferase/UDP-glucuronic acid dehydrogenase (UDP-4-keto-hexauronic acid decarboxylating)